MIWLFAYYALLLSGLAVMLIDGLGWVAFLVYFAGMPLGALAVWWLNRRPLAALGAAPYRGMLRQSAAGMVGAAAAAGAVYALLAAAGWASLAGPERAVGRFLILLAGQQLLVAGVEELAFRGIVQSLLVDRLGGARGLGGAAALFGAFHLPNLLYQGVPAGLIPIALIALTAMGVVFGAAYERSDRRLAFPVALHAGWNIAAYSLEDGLGLRLSGPAWLAGRPEWFPESGLASLVGLALVGGLVWVLTARPAGKPAARAAEWGR